MTSHWFSLLYAAAVDLCKQGRFEHILGRVAGTPPVASLEVGTRAQFNEKWDALWRVCDEYSKEYVALPPPKHDWKSVVRDAFLEGRDADAIRILRSEGIRIDLPEGMDTEWTEWIEQSDGRLHLTFSKKFPGRPLGDG